MYTDIIHTIKARVVLSSVVSKYVKLKRKGDVYWGCCPFHNEKTPSFKVDDKKSSFFCFGCRESGDVFTFLSKFCNFSFKESLKDLAYSFGIDINILESQKKENKSDIEKKRRISVYKSIISHANQNLIQCDSYKNIFNYLIDKKKISLDVIKSFNIGVIEDVEYIQSFFFNMLKLTKNECTDLGLLSKNGFIYFANRLLFPIYNKYGEPIAFGARKIKKKDNLAKYINSPESEWFRKRDELYGLNIAKSYIKNKNSVYVVEGYTDVLALHSIGYNNSVGVLGSALSLEHLNILLSYTSEIGICFDGDNAGSDAMKRVIKMIFEKMPNIIPYVKFIFMPKDCDPCDLVSNNSIEDLHYIMRNKLAISDSIIKLYELEDIERCSLPEKIQEILDSINIDYISLIVDPLYIKLGKDIFYKIKSYFNRKKFEHYNGTYLSNSHISNMNTGEVCLSIENMNMLKLDESCLILLSIASKYPRILHHDIASTLIEKLIYFFDKTSKIRENSIFLSFLLKFLSELDDINIEIVNKEFLIMFKDKLIADGLNNIADLVFKDGDVHRLNFKIDLLENSLSNEDDYMRWMTITLDAINIKILEKYEYNGCEYRDNGDDRNNNSDEIGNWKDCDTIDDTEKSIFIRQAIIEKDQKKCLYSYKRD